MSESFGKKFRKEEVEVLLDPIGFLKDKDKEQYEGLDDVQVKKALSMTRTMTKDRKEEEARRREKKTVSPIEYGLRKKKANDPTRYGEWDVGGRTYDF